jgi:hypothetical protein
MPYLVYPRAMRTSVVALLLVPTLLAGCPRADPPPGGGTTPSTPEPSDSGADATPGGAKPDGNDTPVPSSGDPIPDPSTGTVEVLRPRVVRRCCQNLALGLLRVEGSVARVSVTSGQVSFRAQLVVGNRLRLAKESEIEVLGVDDEGLTVRWLSEVEDALGSVEVVKSVTPADGSVFLEESGLYAIGDVTVGIGNVRASADGSPTATVTVFPKSYSSNPMQDWDLHPDVLAGQTLKGTVRPIVVEDVGVRDHKPGWVRLGWSP